MPFASLAHSPLAGGPATIYYRDAGVGVPLIFLHGGWGYEMYPLDLAADRLPGFRVLIPDRSGYGQSTKPARFDPAFHHYAAAETLALMDALDLGQCVFWGHSDGAVIAALAGLAAPARCRALVLEAFHYDRAKPRSHDFFQTAALRPNFVRDHAQAWLKIAEVPGDLYDGQLRRLSVPTLLVHGSEDPRTEPGELGAVRRELPAARFHVIEGAGHSPHSEPAAAEECRRAVLDFLRV